jgi:hypothetical protein
MAYYDPRYGWVSQLSGPPTPTAAQEVAQVPTAVQMAQEAAQRYQGYVASQQAKTQSSPAPSTPSVSSQPPAVINSTPTTGGTGQTTPNVDPIERQVAGVAQTPEELPPETPADTGPSVRDLINEYLQAQQRARIAALDKAYQQALASLTEQEAGITPQYYDARNRVAAQSDVGALNFAQYMASRGISGSAAGMPEPPFLCIRNR